MRVVLVGPTHPFRGGIAHYTTLLCRALRRDHDVLFVSFSRQYPRWLYPGKSDRDPSRFLLTAPPVRHLVDGLNPLTWRAAWREIAQFRPDLLVLQWWTAYWAPLVWYLASRARKGSDATISVICHNALEHEETVFASWARRIALSKADRILTHSREDAATLACHLGSRVPITAAFHPTYRELNALTSIPSQARQQLGLCGDVLLFFGFVRAYKGLRVLLDALPLVLERRPVHLLVAGEFWEDKRRYLGQLRRLGLESSVTFVDRYLANEELGLYFAAADLVVQPYLTASGSGACQAAFGFGRPVIATSVGSLREVVEDGVNGRLVPAGDSRALARAILESLAPSVLLRLSAGAVQTAERFSWGGMAALVAGRETWPA